MVLTVASTGELVVLEEVEGTVQLTAGPRPRQAKEVSLATEAQAQTTPAEGTKPAEGEEQGPPEVRPQATSQGGMEEVAFKSTSTATTTTGLAAGVGPAGTNMAAKAARAVVAVATLQQEGPLALEATRASTTGRLDF